MKKAIICFLALAILLAMNVSAFAADFENQVDAIPYTVPSSAVTDEMRGLRYDVLEKYPGLKPIDPADVDSTLPVITINSMGELNCFMAGVSAAPLYEEGYDVSAFVNNYLASLEYAQEELAPSLATASNYGDAPAYHQENSESINCYGYAADFNWFIRPGDIYYTAGSQFTNGSTVEDVAGWVEEDFWRADHRPIREISSATASVSSTERRIAVRVGNGRLKHCNQSTIPKEGAQNQAPEKGTFQKRQCAI